MAGRCFILGAGFSKTCGLPLASELTPIVWRARARSDPMDQSPQPPLIQPGNFGYEALEVDLQAIKTLFPDCACDPARVDSWPDFEELITALDEANRFQQSFERLTRNQSDNWSGRAKEHLMRHLQERLSELTEAAVANLGLITNFIESLDLEKDSVISLNWDMLLEIAADDLGVQVNYRDGLGPGLRLAKPHGSLSLVDVPKQEYEQARKKAANVFGLDEELEYRSAGESRLVLRVQDPRESWIRRAWAKSDIAVLVEPNIRKTYDRPWIELQWVRALDMVQTANEIIVIGFSLPKADLRPRILLQLAKLHRNPLPKLIIVDPNAAALRDHYEKLTGFVAAPFVGTLEQWLLRPPQGAP